MKLPSLKRLGRRHWLALIAFGLLLTLIVYARIDASRGLNRLLEREFDQGQPGSRSLIVLLHGYTGNFQIMSEVRQALREARPDADMVSFQYPAQAFSNADPFRIAEQINENIEALQLKRGYNHIILVGFSMGALLLRKAYLYGVGSIADAPMVGGQRLVFRLASEWVKHVDRFVLLAGMNRGWSLEYKPEYGGTFMMVLRTLGMKFAYYTGTGRLVQQMQRGEPFVANLRIQWLEVMRNAEANKLPRPTVIQLLGDVDDQVSKEDSRDVEVSRDFIWVGVHNTGHADLIKLSGSEAGAERKHKIQLAMGNEDSVEQLRRMSPALALAEDKDVKTVVFVLHGIRDMGEWTLQFDSALQNAYANRNPDGQSKLYVHRATYGYFAMGPFLLWSDRQKNVRWFMDQVTELKARFPNMRELHFIGHSNGTYVLASALAKYSTLKVNRVVFAGSVVRRDYPWSGFTGRVEQVRNYVGSADLVVGLFPRFFELPLVDLFNRDIGSAGFNGFEDGFVKNMETQFVIGGHGAALTRENIPSVVDFIIDGKKTDVTSLLTSEHPTWMDYSSKLCWILWLFLATVVVIGWRYAPDVATKVIGKFKPSWSDSQRRIVWLSRGGYALFLWLLLSTV